MNRQSKKEKKNACDQQAALKVDLINNEIEAN